MTTTTATRSPTADPFATEEIDLGPADTHAGRQAAAFMSETAHLGDFKIRKPCLAGMTILTKAKNKFVCGFTPDEIERMFPHGSSAEACRAAGLEFTVDQAELLQYTDDLWEIYRIGIATIEEKKAWYFNLPAFHDAVFDFVSTGAVPMRKIEQMFADAFLLMNEVADSHVEVVPSRDKSSTKKKGPRHHPSRSPTAGHSARRSA